MIDDELLATLNKLYSVILRDVCVVLFTKTNTNFNHYTLSSSKRALSYVSALANNIVYFRPNIRKVFLNTNKHCKTVKKSYKDRLESCFSHILFHREDKRMQDAGECRKTSNPIT